MQLTQKNIRTTIRYTWLDLLDWFDRQNANVIGLLISALLGMGLVSTIVRMNTAPAAAPAPVIIVQTAQAIAVPTAVPVQQVVYAPAPRMVVAFASPENGVVLGAIPEPAASAITGRWGDSWISTTHQGATVWIRLADLGASLGNLAPELPVTAPMPYAQPPQPAYVPQQPYQVDNAPQPPEQPAAPAAAPMVAQPQPQAQPTAQPSAQPSAGIFFEQTAVQIELQRISLCQEHPEWNCR